MMAREQTLSAVFKADAYCGGNPSTLERFVWAYRHWRNAGKPSRSAVVQARLDASTGETRFPTTPIDYGYGRKVATLGESHCRWIENPDAAGLRFEGYADDWSCVDHNGWYCDSFQDSIMRGVVYRLPSKGGVERFAYGYADPWQDGPAFLCFDLADDSDTAARWADGFAEKAAEKERDYQEAADAGSRFNEAADEIAELRDETRTLIREIKGATGFHNAPAIRAAALATVEDKLAERTRLYDKRAELLDTFGDAPGFHDYATGV